MTSRVRDDRLGALDSQASCLLYWPITLSPSFSLAIANNIKTTIAGEKIELPSISPLLATQLFPLSTFPTVSFMHVFFFTTALLRYNSRAIKFTLSKLYNSVFSSRFTELCHNHRDLILRTFHYPPKKPHFH